MTTEKTIAQKMQIRPYSRIYLINAPAGYQIGQLVDQCNLVVAPPAEVVHVFVTNLAELEEFGPQAIAAFMPDGLLWVSYPKKSGPIKSDIHRDIEWMPFVAAGFKPVRQISIDETWSALRWRPESEVGR